jgi:hypothetical protein
MQPNKATKRGMYTNNRRNNNNYNNNMGGFNSVNTNGYGNGPYNNGFGGGPGGPGCGGGPFPPIGLPFPPVGGLRGPKGDNGSQGPQGPKGDKGDSAPNVGASASGSTQTTADTATTTVTYTTEDYDNGSLFPGAGNSTFTIPTGNAGVYTFAGTVNIANPFTVVAPGTLTLRIVAGTKTFTQTVGLEAGATDAPVTINVSGVTNLAVGNTVVMNITNNAGNTITFTTATLAVQLISKSS